MSKLYLEDLSVGQRFSSGSFEMKEDAMKAFASAFDPQPFHLDEEAAQNSLFKGLAASGWYTACVTMRLIVDGGVPIGGGLIGAGGEISWLIPTRAGDVLTVESEITAIEPSRSRPDRGKVTVISKTKNQKDEIVQVLTSKMIVFRRAQG
jgi:acyl dehydratase